MHNELINFRKNLGTVLVDIVTAIDRVAAACDNPKLKEEIFTLNRTVERARRLCEDGLPAEVRSPRGEHAPEFGKGAKIDEL